MTDYRVHLPNYNLPSGIRPMCGAKNAYSYSSADNGFGTAAGYDCEDCKHLVKEYRQQFSMANEPELTDEQNAKLAKQLDAREQ